VTRPPRITTSFRVDRDLWQAAQAKADARGEYLSGGVHSLPVMGEDDAVRVQR
jgi:hypothetical protein